MTCESINSKMLLYIDGNLNHEEVIQFEEHLLSCKKCKTLFEQVSNTYALIDTEKNTAIANSDYAEQIWQQAQKTKRMVQPVNTLRISVITTLAAAGIALGIMVGGTFNKVNLQGASTENWEQLADEYFPEPELDYISSINPETE